MIAEHTGQDLATIARDADRDRWFTAGQTRGYACVGLVYWSRSPTFGPPPTATGSG
ncbi:MAG TPA: ATP-dependent Clp protease proteolytic subunit [Nakamurella sp.]|nr:ATP-dependent Clp protease proteolytic subunit [Nakamurella sp.]